ncbi:hypothetical protein EMIHUDRAFT_354009 [Emiliania huxleyi CCMP1516]|uniref:Ubiquitin-like domain-containing protein n=3 Tax=Emiliania huxleyi TaxID=2903 RepID=A0A0D3JQ90_EMIH1|nr:hypothetical protein EMIHUDRAFT_354009 [Emiliania huxleyi CCMP1516]EOD25675.1 hypothetical protein EMIHUDRAFT_354009 [Emiliania huxleyi CCMP1516]|eukprot:XP_005778104.1 hypothetical protein EMIHUDRAFT_354009 [Emiliania huxleyi CCMP1516]
MSRFAFAGDGAYPGDGGRELQRLWMLGTWRPLKQCDGRYVSRNVEWSALALRELCESVGVTAAGHVVTCREAGPRDDEVQCVRLRGGGGLLTYAKEADGGVARHVHTLNTESGLARKLLALGGGADGRLVRALSDARAAHLFSSLCRLLERVEEPARTRAAPPLATALRLAAARVGAHSAGCPAPAAPAPDTSAAAAPAAPLLRLSLVGAHGVLPSKCRKCDVDTVVLVAPTHAAISEVAVRKLRLKCKERGRVLLTLKKGSGALAAGAVLPREEADLHAWGLRNDAVVAVSVADAGPPPRRQSHSEK